MNRRTFLLGSLATLFSARLAKWMSPSKEEIVKNMEPLATSLAQPLKIPTQEPQELSREIPGVVEKISAVSAKAEKTNFYQNYSDDDRNNLLEKVKTEKEQTSNVYSKDDLDIIIANCLGNQPLVDQVLSEVEFSPAFLKTQIPQLVTAVIFVESKGNRLEESDDIGAKGLMQLKDGTADEVAKELGLVSFDIFDQKTNVTLGMKYLEKLYRIFPEVGLALWAYHLGMGNMLDAIKNKVGDQEINFENVAQVILENKLNFENVVSSPFVSQMIKLGVFGDDTGYYVPRILAVNNLLAN